MILEEPIENWPRVDGLIAFFSTGFPLKKAIAYAATYQPILLNDLSRQQIIRNRLAIYDVLQVPIASLFGIFLPLPFYSWRCHACSCCCCSLWTPLHLCLLYRCVCRFVSVSFSSLQQHDIPHPSYVVVDYESVRRGEAVFSEAYDYLSINGQRINKPFIEKPQEADNHDNWIYYPKNAGAPFSSSIPCCCDAAARTASAAPVTSAGSLSVSFSLSPPSLSLCLSGRLSPLLCLFLSLSFSLCVSVCLCLSPFLFLPLFFSFFLSHFLSLCLSVSLPLSLAWSLLVSVCRPGVCCCCCSLL